MRRADRAMLDARARTVKGARGAAGAYSAPMHSRILAILNVTRDSYSDGGRFFPGGALDPALAVDTAMAMLADGRVLYWDALEGTERVQFSVILEFGDQAANDQSRLLTLGPGDAPSWTRPTPSDGGANSGGTSNTPLLPGLNTNDAQGAGALFCADLVQLADGRILAAGGTNYYMEPGVEPVPFTRQAVEHFVRQEWALTVEDVMIRRSGWHYYRPDARDKAAEVAAWMAEMHGWGAGRRETELAAYRARASGLRAKEAGAPRQAR